MRFTTEDGKVWETTGKNGCVGDIFTDHGIVRSGPEGTVFGPVVRPVVREHQLGGIVFEETGEERVPKVGEWVFVDGSGVSLCRDTRWRSYIILRPVRIES